MDIVIRNPEYAITFALEECLPLEIFGFISKMRFTVEFHNQLAFETNEICEEGTNRILASKL
jgi:hypothetical protein